MIKLIFVLRRARHLTPTEFQHYWLNHHAPLVMRLAPVLRIVRYVQSHTLSGDGLSAAGAVRGCAVEAYDGVAELWWNSMDDILASSSDRDQRAGGRELLEDEQKFLDLPRCSLFFSQEHVIVDRQNSPG